MKNVGKVIHLYISKKSQKNRIKKNTLFFDDKGIVDDKFYNKDIQRSVLITSKDSYTLMEEHAITVPYGTLGENLLIAFNPYSLKHGTKIHIGKTVILEVSQYCTICNHLSTIDTRVPTLLKNDRGIFAKVLTGGVIAEGDNISLEEI